MPRKTISETDSNTPAPKIAYVKPDTAERNPKKRCVRRQECLVETLDALVEGDSKLDNLKLLAAENERLYKMLEKDADSTTSTVPEVIIREITAGSHEND